MHSMAQAFGPLDAFSPEAMRLAPNPLPMRITIVARGGWAPGGRLKLRRRLRWLRYEDSGNESLHHASAGAERAPNGERPETAADRDGSRPWSALPSPRRGRSRGTMPLEQGLGRTHDVLSPRRGLDELRRIAMAQDPRHDLPPRGRL